ncbi:hypothetical protein FHX42_001694 [Saccharopolyspora lacisalsi]|uniref:Uncharacterized protein n=1 Tax=Halosaccharopolyspora lacisalsi TaxID=1000566 RepID=A0A839DY13_9PSEU|nr:hypothetical protein [Halosaccharopolyspora lacisalsi]MBA8824347.1 hypothetical protein [Halosaccharopolyspora lacisalsi]
MDSPVVVQTLIRSRDGSFRSLDESGESRQGEYVEGAIVLTAWGTEILDTGVWDDVDYLWSYISDIVNDLIEGRGSCTCFPDQPIKLSFENVPRGGVVASVDLGEERRIMAIPKEALVDALRAAGNDFLTG